MRLVAWSQVMALWSQGSDGADRTSLSFGNASRRVLGFAPDQSLPQHLTRLRQPRIDRRRGDSQQLGEVLIGAVLVILEHQGLAMFFREPFHFLHQTGDVLGVVGAGGTE